MIHLHNFIPRWHLFLVQVLLLTSSTTLQAIIITVIMASSFRTRKSSVSQLSLLSICAQYIFTFGWTTLRDVCLYQSIRVESRTRVNIATSVNEQVIFCWKRYKDWTVQADEGERRELYYRFRFLGETTEKDKGRGIHSWMITISLNHNWIKEDSKQKKTIFLPLVHRMNSSLEVNPFRFSC